ncbi:MAG: hypothetical protein KJI72_01440 [Patescibacteria group bacterium]|nr:hypothetical protein [Patescibacteria group bacterium]
MRRIFESLAYFFDKLGSKPKTGGLQISDSVIQYVLLEKGKPVSFSLRLPPGVVKGGKIEAPDQLLSLLRQLHKMISSNDDNRKLQVIVSLPPAVIYTQSFNVPKIDQEKLEESAQLNLQIISPIDVGDAHMSWQVIGDTEDRYDLLGAFVSKDVVDKLKSLLAAANFDGLIFEFPALALARVISSSVNLSLEPVIVLQISSDGLDLSILKKGSLYFQYFRSWQSVQGESHEISKAAFEEVVIQEVRRVIDFSLKRFKENVSQVLIIAPGFEGDIGQLLQNHFKLKATMLSVKSYPLAPGWYAVLGSAMRGKLHGGRDTQVNLSGESLVETFYQERALNFIRMWRGVVIGAMLVFLGAFGMSAVFLVKQSNILTDRLNVFKAQISQTELVQLGQKVDEFNNLVGAVEKARRESRPWHQIFSRIKQLADGNNITLGRLSVGASTEPVSLVGRAPSNSQVIKFKNVLVDESDFFNVDLPLAGITVSKDGSVGFNVSFRIR